MNGLSGAFCSTEIFKSHIGSWCNADNKSSESDYICMLCICERVNMSAQSSGKNFTIRRRCVQHSAIGDDNVNIKKKVRGNLLRLNCV